LEKETYLGFHARIMTQHNFITTAYNFWITLGDGGAVIRSMSLNQTASDPRTINGSAKVEGEARAALKDVGVEGLIAQPTH